MSLCEHKSEVFLYEVHVPVIRLVLTVLGLRPTLRHLQGSRARALASAADPIALGSRHLRRCGPAAELFAAWLGGSPLLLNWEAVLLRSLITVFNSSNSQGTLTKCGLRKRCLSGPASLFLGSLATGQIHLSNRSLLASWFWSGCLAALFGCRRPQESPAAIL